MTVLKKISAELLEVARGDAPADLLLENAQLVNVFTGEIYPEDVALWGSFVVGFGEYEARETVDLDGSYLAPGFLDGHVHIESSMMDVPQFARAVVPRGTTSVVADPHEIANVMGYDGIRYILEASKYNPLNVFIMLPSCVPATGLETSGSELRAFDIYPYFKEKWVLGLGEVMNFPGVIHGDPDILEKLRITHRKRIDGHAPGLGGKELCAYAASGVASDHECTTVEEAREKLRAGLHVMIREGTAARNLEALLPLVDEQNSHRCCFVTDDRHPHELVSEGHMDHIVRSAIAQGLDPITAIQMATLNTARYFMLNTHGAVAPGYFADLVVFDDLRDLRVRMVFKNGRKVAEDGRPLWDVPERPRMQLRASVNIRWLEGDEFAIPAPAGEPRVRVIELVPDEILTRAGEAVARVEDGKMVPDVERDLLELAVIERHRATGNIGHGFVRGFGLKEGALATTIAHDSHNIIVVGTNEADMLAAVIELNKLGGGMTVARGGEILGGLALPVAGLMSNEPLEHVDAALAELVARARELGCPLKDPFMTLSFLALPVIPELKLTDRGLVDVSRFEHVPLVIEPGAIGS